MNVNRTSTNNLCALGVYEFVNALFVYKYISRITPHSWTISLFYLVIVNLFVLLLFKMSEPRRSIKMQHIVYFSTVIVFAMMLTFLMYRFDPQNIRVGRYLALHDWISRLFNGKFPYASPERPSGFPFLFMLAMPFYFLGDLGFFQIFSFLVFALLLHLKYRQNGVDRLRGILLLAFSPIFLYEIIVRSDIFSNMVIILLYLAIFEVFSRRADHIASLALLGIIGGLLLATRGIVLLIYIIIFGYFIRRRIITNGLFLFTLLVGFLLALIPFLLWDWRSFLLFGPFSIQLSSIPYWLLILSVAASIFCALSARSLDRVYSSISLILFSVTLAAFLLTVFENGWYKSVLRDGFDISYFCFTLPFLLISMKSSAKPDQTPVDRSSFHRRTTIRSEH